MARDPDEIYEETRKEGQRRLSRPLRELAATAVLGGFDVAIGVIALVLAAGTVHGKVQELVGSIAFGIGFVFIVVGRSELFTENFLIPVAGLDQKRLGSWLKLGELWLVALVLNILGGTLIAVIASSHHVLPQGSGEGFIKVAHHIAARDPLPSFLSAILAGALITVMTWFVEGAADSLGVRIVMAWIVGFVVAIGAFNHVVVVTIELVFGMRYGADIAVSQLLSNLGIAVAGNLVGGLLLVTFVRSVQASESAGS